MSSAIASPNNRHSRQFEEFKATESSASVGHTLDRDVGETRPNNANRQKAGHIFCKNEVV